MDFVLEVGGVLQKLGFYGGLLRDETTIRQVIKKAYF